MTDYTAIDREQLIEHLSELSRHVSESSIDETYAERIDGELSEINSLIHSFDKPIQIEDRAGGYNIVVQSDE